MEYPIFLGGRRAGTLRERAEGLYTFFEAELPEVPEQRAHPGRACGHRHAAGLSLQGLRLRVDDGAV